MDRFREIFDKRHDYAREWKARTGGRGLGYFCTYLPEELAYAAGALPVRIFGSHQPQDVTDRHIYSMYCPYCRDCLAQGLLGKYDYLDGIAKARSCIHMRNAFASWELNIPLSYSHFISTPSNIQSSRAKPFLIKELDRFKKSLEEWTAKEISQEDMERAIDIYNTNRCLTKQLYMLRQRTIPPILGAEAMDIVLSSQVMDKAEHNVLLQEIWQNIDQRQNERDPGIRLMLIGSEDDDTEFVRMVESLGATIVVDEHCTGTRYFWNEVIPEEDKLAAIAQRYIERPPCPAKDFPERRRWPYIFKLIDDYHVQGVILIQQKFCDPHEFDIPPLIALLKERNIPSLFLEFDITTPIGQFRTRVEAFLEMLAMEVI